MPSDGIAQECNTSEEETNTRMGVWAGRTSRLSTSNSRGWPIVKSLV